MTKVLGLKSLPIPIKHQTSNKEFELCMIWRTISTRKIIETKSEANSHY
jgi:hypothetical protein